MPNRMSEDISDRMPEDVPVRLCINVMVGITRSKVIIFPYIGNNDPNSYFSEGLAETTRCKWVPCFFTPLSKAGHCPRTAYLQKGSLPTSGFWSCGLSRGWYLASAMFSMFSWYCLPPALTPKWVGLVLEPEILGTNWRSEQAKWSFVKLMMKLYPWWSDNCPRCI